MYTAVVSDIKSELNDWLNTRGGEVADLALSLINRAIEQLWLRRPWDMLCKSAALSLSNNSAVLPADFGRVVLVGSDSDSDGVLDWFYSNGNRDLHKRYDFENTLSATNAILLTIKFPVTPQYTPFLRYVIKLNRVVNDTDCLFFPATLVLRAAQKIHAVDKSIAAVEVNAINNDYKEQLLDFEESNYHIDRSMQKWQQDSNFNQLYVENYSLDGNISENVYRVSNSEDL